MAHHQPTTLIIVRHGLRLDAADTNWHLTSPAPYNPPLTYGGWNQCRKLGTRIASILHTREEDAATPEKTITAEHGIQIVDFGGEGEAPRKKMKRTHKVVVHTSPFQRCVQTGIALSAGMAEFQAPEDRHTGVGIKQKPVGPLHSVSSSGGLNPGPKSKRHQKSKLRVDGWLGGWLNPQYFEHITPPPPSASMVTTARQELLQNEAIEIFAATDAPSTVSRPDSTHYQAPTPNYAIASSDSLPRGYEAHARNACVDVDFQWDSSTWAGDGGSISDYDDDGETWTALHRRFRKGLETLVEWYAAGERGEAALGFDQAIERTEADEDLVIVLVTHGAGCNALIGALTGQPVLVDVPMASLTLAVAKASGDAESTVTAEATPPPSPPQYAKAVFDLGAAYEMQLVADTAHLHGGVSASPRVGPWHHRLSLGTAPAVSRNNTSRALGSIRRPTATSVPSSSYLKGPAPLSLGLWAPVKPVDAPDAEGEGDDMVLDFSNSPPDSRPGSSSGTPVEKCGLGIEELLDGKAGTADEGPRDAQKSESRADSVPELGTSPSVKGLWTSSR